VAADGTEVREEEVDGGSGEGGVRRVEWEAVRRDGGGVARVSAVYLSASGVLDAEARAVLSGGEEFVVLDADGVVVWEDDCSAHLERAHRRYQRDVWSWTRPDLRGLVEQWRRGSGGAGRDLCMAHVRVEDPRYDWNVATRMEDGARVSFSSNTPPLDVLHFLSAWPGPVSIATNAPATVAPLLPRFPNLALLRVPSPSSTSSPTPPSTPPSTRSTVEGVQGALVDFWALASPAICPLFHTAYSSFGEEAAVARGQPSVALLLAPGPRGLVAVAENEPRTLRCGSLASWSRKVQGQPGGHSGANASLPADSLLLSPCHPIPRLPRHLPVFCAPRVSVGG
jgi:hypothetical protein